MTDPICKSVTVPLTPADAFDLFTRDIATWWPLGTHSLAAANGNAPRRVGFDLRTGGDLSEDLPDGKKARWATVTHWQPGVAFGMDWHLGHPEDHATQVMVTFTPVDTGTRVDLTHGGFAARGASASAITAHYDRDWGHVLGRCYIRQARHCGPALVASFS